MTTFISMLRGVNVGGKKVEMEKLRQDYVALGFAKVRSYIQSGNVIFETASSNVPRIAGEIEKRIEKSFGFDVTVLIRTEDEINRLIESNPFARKDASKLHVTFLRDKPLQFPNDEIIKAKSKAEDFSVTGREVYLFCPDGYGRTKLSNTFFEKKLKVLATTRNWNTVNTLLSLARERI